MSVGLIREFQPNREIVMSKPPFSPLICDADKGFAAFDGLIFKTDSLHDNRPNRVLPILEEEQIVTCRMLKRVVDRLKVKKNVIKVLDVGTGCGVFSIFSAHLGCEVTAIDINDRAISFAVENAKINGISNIRFLKVRFEDFCNKNPITDSGKYDIVILSPPYNPTANNVKGIPLHAFAGDLGQDCFLSQIRCVPSILSHDGICIGNMMTLSTHAAKLNDSSSISLVRDCSDAFCSQFVSIDIFPIIESTCPISEFTSYQYDSSSYQYDRRIGDFFSEVVLKSGYTDFALVYFEASLVNECQQYAIHDCVLKILSGYSWNSIDDSFNWEQRKYLHRVITDHRADCNTILSSKTQDYLFRTKVSNDKNDDLDARRRDSRFKASIFKMMESFFSHMRWGYVNNGHYQLDDKSPFEFIGINLAPYDAEDDGPARENRIQFWSSTQRIESDLVDVWRQVTATLQKNGVGVYNNHFFRYSKSWNISGTQGLYSVCDGSSIPVNLTKDAWSEFEIFYNSIRDKVRRIEPVSSVKFSMPGYYSELLRDIVVHNDEENNEKQEKAADGEKYLFALHWNMHFLLRTLCQKFSTNKTDCFLASFPVGFVIDASEPKDTGGYGAIWVYAKKSNQASYSRAEDAMIELCKAALYLADEVFDSRLEKDVLRNINKLKEAYTSSAISSIMSRNGSHNIGSHVLSALSHNVSTMPDDRILYQYIQQRMDYIATVTTDFPAWSQPTMLISGLMKEFLSQRHLLEHIAESEGLSAWEFQNVNLLKSVSCTQKRKIKIHILRKVEGRGAEEVLEYDDNGSTVHLDWDVPLAIPGGVVGNHAFYTILENVIRNSAKHGWSTRSDQKCLAQNLEIFLEYFDTGECVEFKISDNMSSIGDGRKKCLNYKDGKFFDDNGNVVDQNTQDLPLHWKLQLKLAKEFVSEGRLRKEDWGLAEMKISAGYLMSRNIRDIGGLEDASNDYDNKEHSIVRPCVVEDALGAHLGYQFKIRKPRVVVFVLDENNRTQKQLLDLTENNGIRDRLREMGFVFRTLADIQDDCARDKFGANYVVLPYLREKHKKEMLPFRVLVWTHDNVKSNIEYRKDLIGAISLSDVTKLVRNFSGIDIDKLKDELYRCVADAWLAHLRKDVANRRIELFVNTRGDDSNGGRGLITDSDILKFIFQNCFRTAIETFINGYERMGQLVPEIKFVLTALHAMPIINDEHLSDETGGKLIDFKVFSAFSVETMIAWQLIAMLDKLTFGNAEYGERFRKSCEKFYHETDQVLNREFKDVLDYLRFTYCVAHKMEYMRSKYESETDETIGQRIYEYKYAGMHPSQMGDFVNHLADVFRQTDVFLRKYEERIVTLPSGFSKELSGDVKALEDSKFNWPNFVTYRLNETLQEVSADSDRVIYYRHYKPSRDDLGGALYREPLSGTQSYLNALIRLVEGVQSHQSDVLITKLIENAVLKVCVADERVAKFLRDHDTVRNTYAVENIHVVDEKYVEYCLHNKEQAPSDSEFSEGGGDDGLYRPRNMSLLLDIIQFVVGLSEESRKIDEKDEYACDAWIKKQVCSWTSLHPNIEDFRISISKLFDILIVHQGLIDKWLGGSAHSKYCVAVFLEILKEYIKYVVITTGRGTPANIPVTARVLPFSTIESTLFKMYPEKLVLVDTVMNILPVGK